MTDDEIDRLAEQLAKKIKNSVTDDIYRDAGKNLLSTVKNVFWAIVIAFAAWGAARYGNGNGPSHG